MVRVRGLRHRLRAPPFCQGRDVSTLHQRGLSTEARKTALFRAGVRTLQRV